MSGESQKPQVVSREFRAGEERGGGRGGREELYGRSGKHGTAVVGAEEGGYSDEVVAECRVRTKIAGIGVGLWWEGEVAT